MNEKDYRYNERLENVIDSLISVKDKLAGMPDESEDMDVMLQCIELMSGQLVKKAGLMADNAVPTGNSALVENSDADDNLIAEAKSAPADRSATNAKPAEADSVITNEKTAVYSELINGIGSEGIDPSIVNLKAYTEEFAKLYEELTALGLYWDDSEEYYAFMSDMDQICDEIKGVSTDEALEILKDNILLIRTEMYDYKDEMSYLDYLSDDAMRRIRLINRLDFLLYKLEHGVKDPKNDYNLLLGERLIQVCLCKGLNGEHHSEYLSALLDLNFIYNVAIELATAKPIVQRYGKPVSTKDKLKLLEIDDEKAVIRSLEILKFTQEEFLSFSPTCKAFLDGLK